MTCVRLVGFKLCDSLFLGWLSASMTLRLLLGYLPFLDLNRFESVVASERLGHHRCGARLRDQLLLRLLPLSDRVWHTHFGGS